MLRSRPLHTKAKVPCQVISVRYYNSEAQERYRILVRRINKAERDERMDLTTALTPVRTYMGGFTRPTDIRASKWFSGGEYAAQGRPYAEPSAFAYEPHTVFLLESRYDIKYGVGRKDHPAHIVGICRTADFEAVMQKFNSKLPPPECLEYMDNARWPWLKSKKAKQQVWWNSAEERSQILQDLNNDVATNVEHEAVQDALRQASHESNEEEVNTKKEFRRHLAQTAAVAARVSEEQHLSGIATEIKAQVGKIPFELEFDDGTVRHPSGFVPPTPADKHYDPGYHLSPHPNSKIAKELRRRQMDTVNEHHSDSLVPRIEQWKALKERQSEVKEGGLMENLTSGILSGDLAASTEPRDAKIPIEIHGIQDQSVAQPMQHASGFVPPTARMSRGETDARTSVVDNVDNSVPAPEAPERAPTFASEADSHTSSHPKPQDAPVNVTELRQKYSELIKTEPFWRPLIALTVSTRPIAKTLARLSRGLSKGVAFHAAVDPNERKDQASFASRLRSLRVTRMRTLAVELAQLFDGARGGPIGVRFDEKSRGRGIDGEGLEEPIPWDKRVIGVGIGKWYPLADELVESFKLLAEKEVAKEHDQNKSPFLIYKFDDFGRPEGEKPQFPWPSLDMSDAIRAGLQARLIVRKVEKLLKIDPPTGKVISVKMASGNWSKQDVVEKGVRDHRNPIIISFVDQSKSASEDELVDGLARAELKQRVDSFYAEHIEGVALVNGMRVNGVIYPSLLQEENQYIKSTETWQLTPEEERQLGTQEDLDAPEKDEDDRV